MVEFRFEDLVKRKNAKGRYFIPRLKSFDGRTLDQMPLLIAEERKVATPKLVMQERVYSGMSTDGILLRYKLVMHEKVFSDASHDRDLLRYNYFDTAAIAFGDPAQTGEVIIALPSDPDVARMVYSLNPQTKLAEKPWFMNPTVMVPNGSVAESKDVYDAIRSRGALRFSASAANKLRNNPFSEQNMRLCFWDYVSEGDSKLVVEYANLLWGFQESMGLYLHEGPGWRLITLYSVGANNKGQANFDFGIASGTGRLIGIAKDGPMQSDLDDIVQENK